MAFVSIQSRALSGFSAPSVSVEVDVSPGTGRFTLVGLPEVEVREAKDRVRAAIVNSQFEWPLGDITVNLAPADLPKESGRFDLPIAVGILVVAGHIPKNAITDYEFAGELSLSGELRPIRGSLAMAWRAMGDKRAFILPTESATEAAFVEGAKIIGAGNLLAITAHLRGLTVLPFTAPSHAMPSSYYADLSEVKGQIQAKRVLEITASGGHHLLMVGPPGTGKSMLASRLPSILPPMTQTQAMESAAVQSLAQGAFRPELFRVRPYRSPHHTASAAALVGGGANPRPGEISLAHHGVLFLDELPEFDRKVLEVLREPIEVGKIVISRAMSKVEFPARFQLIAAMNPCPCGYFGHPKRECRCTPTVIEQYSRKISGPLLDRIDICIEVPSLSSSELQRAGDGETSLSVRHRVERTFAYQMARQASSNAMLSATQLDRYAPLSDDGRALLAKAMDKLALSARAYYRILRVARTIADMEQVEVVTPIHLSEAIQYRRSRLLSSS